MIRAILLIALSTLATTSSAATLRGATKQTIMVGGVIAAGAAPRRAINICLVPDIQNQTSQTDGPVVSSTTCAVDQDSDWCFGSYCADSIYCETSWEQTGERILSNMAYGMTGQWSQINWDGINGYDTEARSRLRNGPDHPPCDLIIGLGDNMDTCDNAVLATATRAQRHEYDAALGFWRIVKASGIPYIIARGNHESESMFASMLSELGYSGETFVEDNHADGDQYAISLITNTGKSFCVLTMDYNDGSSLTASEITWITTNVGCGSSMPTIIARHEVVGSNGVADNALHANGTTLIADAANDEIFLFAGGHWTPAVPLSTKGSTTNVGGKAVFRFFSDWQEENRHNTGATVSNIPYGTTASDGCGGMYTIIRIDPADDVLTAWDWNPYYMTRSDTSKCLSQTVTSTYSVTFDFDARYP